MHLKDEAVYSDRRWLVYMLDQIIGNAVKYREKTPHSPSELTFPLHAEQSFGLRTTVPA
ncbi:hypothetical protein LC724_04030 [Blautia sp. RD014234]|nr:hypothetical protein [Blautia parvula]